jgi:hypothetical protein
MSNLPEAVTDVIVDRGGRKVIRNLAGNASARREVVSRNC